MNFKSIGLRTNNRTNVFAEQGKDDLPGNRENEAGFHFNSGPAANSVDSDIEAVKGAKQINGRRYVKDLLSLIYSTAFLFDSQTDCSRQMIRTIENFGDSFSSNPNILESPLFKSVQTFNENLLCKISREFQGFSNYIEDGFQDSLQSIHRKLAAKENSKLKNIDRVFEELKSKKNEMSQKQKEYFDQCESLNEKRKERVGRLEKQIHKKEMKELGHARKKYKMEYLESYKIVRKKWESVKKEIIREEKEYGEILLEYQESLGMLHQNFLELFPNNRYESDDKDSPYSVGESQKQTLVDHSGIKFKIFFIENEYTKVRRYLRETSKGPSAKRRSSLGQKKSTLVSFYQAVQQLLDARVNKIIQECVLLSHAENSGFLDPEKTKYLQFELNHFIFKDRQLAKFFLLNYVIYFSLKARFDDLNWHLMLIILDSFTKNKSFIFSQKLQDNQLLFLTFLFFNFVQNILTLSLPKQDALCKQIAQSTFL